MGPADWGLHGPSRTFLIAAGSCRSECKTATREMAWECAQGLDKPTSFLLILDLSSERESLMCVISLLMHTFYKNKCCKYVCGHLFYIRVPGMAPDHGC